MKEYVHIFTLAEQLVEFVLFQQRRLLEDDQRSLFPAIVPDAPASVPGFQHLRVPHEMAHLKVPGELAPALQKHGMPTMGFETHDGFAMMAGPNTTNPHHPWRITSFSRGEGGQLWPVGHQEFETPGEAAFTIKHHAQQLSADPRSFAQGAFSDSHEMKHNLHDRHPNVKFKNIAINPERRPVDPDAPGVRLANKVRSWRDDVTPAETDLALDNMRKLMLARPKLFP